MPDLKENEKEDRNRGPAWHRGEEFDTTKLDEKKKSPGTFDFLESFSRKVRSLPEFEQRKPPLRAGIAAFCSRVAFAIRLTLREKEIITFALLQAAAIGIAYFLWVQILGWMPEEAWDRESEDASVWVYVLFLGWSILCIGFAAFFVGIFSGCIGAVHFLHRQGEKSTIARCLKIVMPQGLRLWLFHWLDAVFTCKQILNRLPKKDDDTTPAQRALSEALYYAWKVGSIGFLPSLLLGKTLLGAGKDSLNLVKNRFLDLALLRSGYSAVCWIIGILTYVCGVYFLFQTGFISLDSGESEGIQVYRFFLGAGIPILISVAVIQVFVRPIFLISLCDIYSEFLSDRNENVTLADGPNRGKAALVAFLVFAVILAAAAVTLKPLLAG